MLYRQFEIRCSEKRLIELSEWLNDNLNWNNGEDFNKIEFPPTCDSDERGSFEALLCKTDRKMLAGYLLWMADYIEEHRDGRTKTDNRIRITRNIARKLQK